MMLASRDTPELANPILPCDKMDGCAEYTVAAKGFFSLYKEKMQGRVLDGARSLVFEASSCTDISLEPDGDPKEYLSQYFEKNIKQLGDAAIKINYVNTSKV